MNRGNSWLDDLRDRSYRLIMLEREEKRRRLLTDRSVTHASPSVPERTNGDGVPAKGSAEENTDVRSRAAFAER